MDATDVLLAHDAGILKIAMPAGNNNILYSARF